MYPPAEAIAKSAWLCVTAIGVCLSTVPQQKPSEKCREKFSASSTAPNGEGCSAVASLRFNCKAAIATFGISYFPYLFSAWVVCMSTLDTIHALDLFPEIMPVSHTTAARKLNAQLTIGFILTTVSTALRFTAIQTMGKLFTYHLAILPDHKLVTHGIYAYCRHPSYAPLPFMFMGVLLTTTAPGSVLYDHLGVDWTRKLVTVLALAIARGSYEFVGRAEVEDQVLRKEFGKEWEEWARKVPYKFFPYIF
jgi:protein-S-isoprenylcysteine O-methyltransferase Ste14